MVSKQTNKQTRCEIGHVLELVKLVTIFMLPKWMKLRSYESWCELDRCPFLTLTIHEHVIPIKCLLTTYLMTTNIKGR